MAPDDNTSVDQSLDEVLHFLMQNMTVSVSGEKLARDLGVPHSRVVRWVDRLRSEGIDILGEAFTGFRLTRLPDVLLPQLIRDRLHTRAFGRTLHHLYRVESTNSYASDLLSQDKPAAHGTVVVAERQTAGRGRMGRSWVSSPGVGLYTSIILRPEISSNLAPLLTLGTAVAAHDSIERATALEVDIKWPNDLLIGRKKICGILSELQAEVDRVRAMIIGVGINVNQEEFPDEIADRATSLRLASGRAQSRIEILQDFLHEFERLYERFREKGPSAIIDRWTRLSSFANGRTIEVDDGVRRVRGVTSGLNALGALRIAQPDGAVEEVYSGDVVHWE